tara:strand:+ start:383 stop:703 length:321 start_codon:yes stop_codon:yes gene_type:complete
MITGKYTYRGHLLTFGGSKKSFSFTSNEESMDKMVVMERGAKSSKCNLDNVMDVVFAKVTDNPDNSGRELHIYNEETGEEKTLIYDEARALLLEEDSNWVLNYEED